MVYFFKVCKIVLSLKQSFFFPRVLITDIFSGTLGTLYRGEGLFRKCQQKIGNKGKKGLGLSKYSFSYRRHLLQFVFVMHELNAQKRRA